MMTKADLERVTENAVHVARASWDEALPQDHASYSDGRRFAIGQIAAALVTAALREEGVEKALLE